MYSHNSWYRLRGYPVLVSESTPGYPAFRWKTRLGLAINDIELSRVPDLCLKSCCVWNSEPSVQTGFQGAVQEEGGWKSKHDRSLDVFGSIIT